MKTPMLLSLLSLCALTPARAVKPDSAASLRVAAAASAAVTGLRQD